MYIKYLKKEVCNILSYRASQCGWFWLQHAFIKLIICNKPQGGSL